jgi:hypothetical protein
VGIHTVRPSGPDDSILGHGPGVALFLGVQRSRFCSCRALGGTPPGALLALPALSLLDVLTGPARALFGAVGALFILVYACIILYMLAGQCVGPSFWPVGRPGSHAFAPHGNHLVTRGCTFISLRRRCLVVSRCLGCPPFLGLPLSPLWAGSVRALCVGAWSFSQLFASVLDSRGSRGGSLCHRILENWKTHAPPLW